MTRGPEFVKPCNMNWYPLDKLDNPFINDKKLAFSTLIP